MQLSPNTAFEDEEINPQEEAALRAFVGRTNIGCTLTAVQTAVTTADMVWQQDWSQEGRKLLREMGIAICYTPAMRLNA